MAVLAGARSRADQLAARVRRLGLRESVAIERETFRRILKSTIAATLSWLAAEAIDSPRPALAALAAIIVLQITVRASLARSIQLTVAVTLGLGGSVALGHLLGVSWWSIGLVVLLGLIAGELLRLGALSGQVAISAMLALSLGSGYGIERTIDTAIGALIGVLVNVAISPASYVAEAGRTLRAIGEDLGVLLQEMGNGLPKDPDEDVLRRWLARARDLSADSRAAIAVVKQSEESLQFNPRGRLELDELSRFAEARRALDHAITQTRGIARSLLDLPRPLSAVHLDEALLALGMMISEAGEAVSAFGRLLQDSDSTADRELLDRVSERASSLAASAVQALGHAGFDEPGEPPSEQTAISSARASAGRLLVSVFVDVERLVREVDITSGEHRAAILGASSASG
jgi:uncharacterized membrane protein YgaE (UPF0421/DUF939 family)